MEICQKIGQEHLHKLLKKGKSNSLKFRRLEINLDVLVSLLWNNCECKKRFIIKLLYLNFILWESKPFEEKDVLVVDSSFFFKVTPNRLKQQWKVKVYLPYSWQDILVFQQYLSVTKTKLNLKGFCESLPDLFRPGNHTLMHNSW